MKPHKEQPVTAGYSVMFVVALDSEEKVRALHAKALAFGGQDEGAPAGALSPRCGPASPSYCPAAHV